MAGIDRNPLYAHEAFAIGSLQAVSGGSLFASLAQLGSLSQAVGRVAAQGLISAMALALLCAVLAAWLRHRHRFWQVRAEESMLESQRFEITHPRVTQVRADSTYAGLSIRRSEQAAALEREAGQQDRRAGLSLMMMRATLSMSVFVIVAALVGLIVALWR